MKRSDMVELLESIIYRDTSADFDGYMKTNASRILEELENRGMLPPYVEPNKRWTEHLDISDCSWEPEDVSPKGAKRL